DRLSVRFGGQSPLPASEGAGFFLEPPPAAGRLSPPQQRGRGQPAERQAASARAGAAGKPSVCCPIDDATQSAHHQLRSPLLSGSVVKPHITCPRRLTRAFLLR